MQLTSLEISEHGLQLIVLEISERGNCNLDLIEYSACSFLPKFLNYSREREGPGSPENESRRKSA